MHLMADSERQPDDKAQAIHHGIDNISSRRSSSQTDGMGPLKSGV